MITDLQRKWLYTRGGLSEKDLVYMNDEPHVMFKAGRGRNKLVPLPSDKGIMSQDMPYSLTTLFLKHMRKKLT